MTANVIMIAHINQEVSLHSTDQYYVSLLVGDVSSPANVSMI